MIHFLRQDLLYALRMIVKTPIITLIAVLSLSLGIAANVSIFAMVDSWLLRPLPYPDPDRLLLVWENDLNDGDDTQLAAPANYFDWQEQSRTLGQWAALSFGNANLTGRERPQQLTVARVTPGIFHLLGASPIVGRTFLADEGDPGDPPTVVLSEALWRNTFDSDPAVAGTLMTLDGQAHTVVGVMPETFDFVLGTVDLWIADTFEEQREERRNHPLIVTARLAPGSGFDQAQAEMSTIASRLEELHPETNRGWLVNVDRVREMFPGRTDSSLIRILMIVVFMVLLIACFNVANLLLAKTEARQKEIAIRRAMGAGRGRIARQLLTESLLLSLLAGGAGIALSMAGVRTLGHAMPAELPAFFLPRFDGSVASFGVLLAVFSGLLFGITPVLQTVGSRDARSPLLEGGRGGTASVRRRRLRSAFVMAQFALALTILIGSAVLGDVFHRRLAVEPGFDASNLLTVQINLPEYRYDDDEKIRQFLETLELHLAEIADVTDAGRATALPRTPGIARTPFVLEGVPTEKGEELSAVILSVSNHYFETLVTPVLQGRSFGPSDLAEAPPVVMINARLAERFFPDGDAVGRRIIVGEETREIVGVAANITQLRLSGLEPEPAALYVPEAQRPWRSFNLLLRTTGDPHGVTSAVQQAVWAVDPDQPIARVQTLDEHIAIQLAGPDMLAELLFQLGLLTLALAAIGIYGVMAYAVSQQGTEIGIRMALGARPRQILGRVTRQGLALATVGLLAGVPLASGVVYLISRMLQSGAREIGAIEGITAGPILQVSVLLAAVGVAACMLPALRATKVDPVRVLQEE